VGPGLYSRYGIALEDDVKRSDQVHRREHGHDGVLGIYVELAVFGNSHQHESNAELDRDDGGAVEYLEQEEPLPK
jgi:hypothetical protein